MMFFLIANEIVGVDVRGKGACTFETGQVQASLGEGDAGDSVTPVFIKIGVMQ